LNVRLRQGGRWLHFLGPAAITLALACGLVAWARIHLTSLRYLHADLLHETNVVRGEVEKLRVEAAALAAPDRIEQLARKQGLIVPEAGQVVVLGTQRTNSENPQVASGPRGGSVR
jgi:cell division protein FtsL